MAPTPTVRNSQIGYSGTFSIMMAIELGSSAALCRDKHAWLDCTTLCILVCSKESPPFRSGTSLYNNIDVRADIKIEPVRKKKHAITLWSDFLSET
ncbi:hypothetical protein V1517DRAFT_324705 [Lipomyces orientalis]|uniref:Uncharacterized protein n=1 Tax=Lipomyces orientalis TaxID=1233043 RepID=A0ACC3TLL7_9ASCO